MTLRGILRTAGSASSGNRRVAWATTLVQENPQPQHTITGEEDGATETTAEESGRTLRLATLNITDGRRNRLNAALRCMRQMNVDVAVLTETKFQNNKFTKNAEGFKVFGTVTEGKQGGVALIYRTAEDWVLESTQAFGPNVVRATIVSGQRRWYLIGAYVPPSEEDGHTLDCITSARDSVNNHHWPVILMGDFNVDLSNPAGNSSVGAERRLETATLLASMGVSSMRDRFRQGKNQMGRYWTWKMRREGSIHGAVCDHILTDDPQYFTSCRIKTPRFDTDHYALVGGVRLGSARHHRRYVRGRSRNPLKKLTLQEMNAADVEMAELREAVEKRPKTDGRATSWISDATWRLIDQKADARRRGRRDLLRHLGKEVTRALRIDRSARAEKAAMSACALLQENKIREAFGAIKGWYRDVGPSPPKPSPEEINLTRTEYENLFSEAAPEEPPFPVHVEAADIDDSPPSEYEVVQNLKKLRNNRAAGVSGITAEMLKEWYEAAQEADSDEESDTSSVELWSRVLKLIRLAFEDGVVPRDFCHGILVLIPKSTPGEYRGIALLDIIYKLVSSIINQRISSKIEFDDAIHGFREGRGTGTAILEAKLLAQLRCRSDEPLFMVFLDLKKAYDTLNRTQAMRILEAYGVGPNIRRLIQAIWDGDTMIPRQAGYYGRAFRARRGVRQGDIVSPLIFNIMVDAVVRHWRHVQNPRELDDLALFYADDGMVSGGDAETVQRTVDQMTKDFKSIGLKMNARKTEYMIMSGGRRIVRRSARACARIQTGEGMSHRQRSLQKILCTECGVEVTRQYLKTHLKTQKCQRARLTYAPPTPMQRRMEEEQSFTPVVAPSTYNVSIPMGDKSEVRCPVEGCEHRIRDQGGSMRFALRRHFCRRHVEDTIVIDEEGLLPKCIRCGLFSTVSNTDTHFSSKACREGAERRRKLRQAKKQEEAKDMKFYVEGEELKKRSQFKYLGRVLDDQDDDDHAALRQLGRAREKWGRVSHVLNSQGASSRARGYFYKAIIQAVLLYGSESWTLSERTLKLFRSFHSRVARYLTGRHIRQLEDGTWHCPPTADTLHQAGLKTIDEYIQRRRDTVRSFVRPRPLYQACIRTRPLASNINKVVWWRLD